MKKRFMELLFQLNIEKKLEIILEIFWFFFCKENGFYVSIFYQIPHQYPHIAISTIAFVFLVIKIYSKLSLFKYFFH